MRGSLPMKVGRANVALTSAPWEARKSQSYTVSGPTRIQRAAMNHLAAGPTKKCFGSIRIRKERYAIPPKTWIARQDESTDYKSNSTDNFTNLKIKSEGTALDLRNHSNGNRKQLDNCFRNA